MDKNEVYDRMVCALTHDIDVCDVCRKCEGDNGAEIRMGLVRELSGYMGEDLPWKEEETVNRNLMGCDERWYDPEYAINQTFSKEEIERMSEEEMEHLVRLAESIGEALF